jgi:hypothetical protein
MNWNPGLDGGNIHLAVSLRGVAIADREQRARDVDRHIERGAGTYILVVDVADMHSRRAAADSPQGRRRSDPHRSEEGRRQRDNRAGRDLGRPRLTVDGDDALEISWEFVGQRSLIGALAVEAVIDGQIDGEYAHLQHVARHGAGDCNRAGQDLPAGTAIRYFPEDRTGVIRDHARLDHAGLIDGLGLDRGGGGLDGDDIA